MNLFLAFRLAARRFFSAREKTTGHKQLRGAIIGIGLSLVPFIIVLQISSGMIEGITARYLETYTYHFMAESYVDRTLPELTDVSERIENNDFVVHAAIELNGYALAAANSKRAGLSLRGISADQYEQDSGFKKYMTVKSGQFDLSSSSNIVLGDRIAKKLEVKPGDTIKVLTARKFGDKLAIKPNTFTVTGLVSSGYRELDKLWAFIPLDRANRILPLHSNSDYNIKIGIKVKDPFSGIDELAKKLRDSSGGGWKIRSWKQAAANQYSNYAQTKFLLTLIMYMIVLVSCVNIASSLITLVMEKRTEIAILRSLGIDSYTVGASFIINGFFTGVIGAAAGIFTGLLISININQLISGIETAINFVSGLWSVVLSLLSGTKAEFGNLKVLNPDYYLENIPLSINAMEIVLVAVVTISVSTLIAFFPAWSATRVRPLEILRKH